jgi:hypothetical protein
MAAWAPLHDHDRMEITQHVVVFDTADLGAESSFWAGLLGGEATEDDVDWHTVHVDGRAVVAFQLAPNHVPPDWPDGAPQQVHLDLHVRDIRAAHDEAVALGARVLRGADLDADEGFQVYADPSGHPYCLCW